MTGIPTSLDELLKSSKAQFDNAFSSQMREIGLIAASPRPATVEDLASASVASAAENAVSARLNRQFGDRWSFEVVENKSERGGVSVLG